MRSLLHLVRLCFLFAAFLACGHGTAHSEIVIGAAFPMTGANSGLGEPTWLGIQWAVNEINRNNGLTIKGKTHRLRIERANDACDGDRAKHAAEELLRKRRSLEPS